MLKKTLLALCLAASCAFFVPPAYALTINNGLNTAAGSGGAGYNTSGASLQQTVGYLIGIMLSFLGVVLLVLIIYAGWLWMTAQGDPKKVEKGQKIMRDAVVGLVIVLSAYALTQFVITQLSSSSQAVQYGADPSYSSE